MTSLFRTTTVLHALGGHEGGYIAQGCVQEVNGHERSIGGMGETEVIQEQK
jgi:hypothetical protein